MKKNIAVCLSIVLLILSACSSAGGDAVPTESQSSNKPDTGYDVRFLFEVDGCKLYSFYDNGRRVYFANCANGSTKAETQFSENCGKGCTRTVRLETVGVSKPE